MSETTQPNETNEKPVNGNGAANEAQAESQSDLVAGLQAQLKEKEEKYVYLYADFENFKKRAQKEKADWLKFGWEPVARELLPVADNLERALSFVPANTDKNLIEGLKMVLAEFRNTLKRQGVEAIEALNQPFDPMLHDAIANEPSEKPQGMIIQEQLKGYTLHGRLLRPARVIVSAGAS